MEEHNDADDFLQEQNPVHGTGRTLELELLDTHAQPTAMIPRETPPIVVDGDTSNEAERLTVAGRRRQASTERWARRRSSLLVQRAGDWR